MAEGYLKYSVGELCDEIEAYTGDTTAGAALKLVIAGYRDRFLPAIDPRTQRASHTWSFLRPWAQIVLGQRSTGLAVTATAATDKITEDNSSPFDPSMVGNTITIDGTEYTITSYTSAGTIGATVDADAYDQEVSTPYSAYATLPADFGGLDTQLQWQWKDGNDSEAVRETTPEHVFDLWRQSTDTGAPEWYAVLPSSTAGTWYIIVAPRPDAAYTAFYRYRRLATDITDSSSVYMLGTSQLVMAAQRACAFAEAELKTGRTNGVWSQRASEAMIAAIDEDRRLLRTRRRESLCDVYKGM